MLHQLTQTPLSQKVSLERPNGGSSQLIGWSRSSKAHNYKMSAAEAFRSQYRQMP